MPRKKLLQDLKNTIFPKIRLETWRLNNYRAAHRWLCMHTGRKLNFSEWIRETMDDEVEATFERLGDPPKDILKTRR